MKLKFIFALLFFFCLVYSKECTTMYDCESNERCGAGACIYDPGACRYDFDCQSWERCGASNYCMKIEGYCFSNNDCALNKKCNSVSHSCIVKKNGACAADSDCSKNTSCIKSKCVAVKQKTSTATSGKGKSGNFAIWDFIRGFIR